MVVVGLAIAVFVTAMISGVLGMTGGLILMTIYGWYLPITAAMVLHGTTQLASNGFRAYLLRSSIEWKSLSRYLIGAAIPVVILRSMSIVVDRAAFFIAMGSLTLAALAIPQRFCPRLDRTGPAILSGCVVMAGQLLAGAVGPLLSLFFVRTEWSRQQVIATKAVTQAIGHAVKIAYFATLVDTAHPIDLPIGIYPLVILCAFAGTGVGKALLMRLSDHQFRRASFAAIVLLSLLNLWLGVSIWLR